jgi:hypothetical protein
LQQGAVTNMIRSISKGPTNMTVRRRPADRNTPLGPGWETGPASPGERGPLLTLRQAVILIAGLVIGTAAGVLAYLAGGRAADAVLAGGAASAAAISLLNTLIA